jgi:hypothetical protein
MRNVGPFVVLVLAGLAARPARAQQSASSARPPLQSAHAPDSGRIVLDQQLGGDSVQAARLDLRRGAIYLVEVRPERANVQVRRRVRDGSTSPPLDTVPIPRTDSLLHWRQFGVVAREGGAHVAELTNPGVGATQVRVTLLRRAIDDTVPSSARRTLVFSEIVGGGPSYVTLDSGVVYRVVAQDAVSLAPRSGYRAPLRIAPLVRGGGTGVPIIPEFTGEYRIDTDASASVQIWREEADPTELACIRNTGGPGCHGPKPHISVRSVLIIGLALPFIMLVDALFR